MENTITRATLLNPVQPLVNRDEAVQSSGLPAWEWAVITLGGTMGALILLNVFYKIMAYLRKRDARAMAGERWWSSRLERQHARRRAEAQELHHRLNGSRIHQSNSNASGPIELRDDTAYASHSSIERPPQYESNPQADTHLNSAGLILTVPGTGSHDAQLGEHGQQEQLVGQNTPGASAPRNRTIREARGANAVPTFRVRQPTGLVGEAAENAWLDLDIDRANEISEERAAAAPEAAHDPDQLPAYTPPLAEDNVPSEPPPEYTPSPSPSPTPSLSTGAGASPLLGGHSERS